MEQSQDTEVRCDFEAWFASWEWESTLPQPALHEKAAQARREAAGIAFDSERTAAGADVEKILLATTSGILAERFNDVRNFLKEVSVCPLPDNADWRWLLERSVFQGWTKLLADDLDRGELTDELKAVRDRQVSLEATYLDAAQEPRAAAWRLVALYHLMGALNQALEARPLQEVEASLDRSARSCLRADHYELHGLVCRLWAAYRISAPRTSPTGSENSIES